VYVPPQPAEEPVKAPVKKQFKVYVPPKSVEELVQAPVELYDYPVTQDEAEFAIKRAEARLEHASNTNSQSDIEEAEKFVKHAVRSARTFDHDSDSPASHDAVVKASELEAIVDRLKTGDAKAVRKFKLIKRVEGDLSQCIDVKYLPAGSEWKTYFPKGTRVLRIGVGKTYEETVVNIRCNYYFALQLFKDYNPDKYRNLHTNDLKQMLVETYHAYKDYRRLILHKWRIEKPVEFEQSDGTPIENIIMSETYPITKVDMVLLMFRYKLPIVFLHQAKEKIKALKIMSGKTDFFYYIKMKGDSIFMLYTTKDSYKLFHPVMNPEFVKKIKSTSTSLDYYLRSDDF
jgi:hypothetical protein